MGKKTYPLDVENVGSDTYIVMSRGHHDIHEFMRAVRIEGYDWHLGIPQHRWAKVVPDTTGACDYRYVFVKEGTRGSFPVTYSWEAYSQDTYEARYPSGGSSK